MGNSQCVDCKTDVPTGVELFNWSLFRRDGSANELYKFFECNTWIKLKDEQGEDKGYLCPSCLDRRVEQERREEQRRREEVEKRKRAEELDQTRESWITKRKKANLELQQAKIFDDNTNQIIIKSDFLHETEGEDDVMIGRLPPVPPKPSSRRKLESAASPNVPNMGKTQKVGQVPSGKSVEDITREIEKENLSTLDVKEINGVLDVVSEHKEQPRPYELKPNPVRLRETLTKDYSNDELSICIAQMCYAVKLDKGYWPRDTQLVSLCLLIKSLQEGRLLEIKTGEGKSCIIAMFAVFLALSGRSVDIVTSSPILAARDADEWRHFYKKFEIEVDCNLIPKENEDRLKCYKKTVVYGTVGSFASDILRQEFLMEDVRGDRKFDAVIVDEVDSMLLDQGINFTYLSSPAPGMHHIQPILLMIWNEVIRHPVVRSDLGQNVFVGKPEPFHVALSKVIDNPNPLNILCLLEQNGVLRKGFIEDVQEEVVQEKVVQKEVVQEEVVLDENQKSLFSKEMTKEKLLKCLLWVETNFDISIEMFEMYDEPTIHKVNKYHDGKQAHLQLLIVGEGLVCVLYQDKKTLCELIKAKIESFLTTGCQKEEKCRYEFPSYLSEFVHNRLPQWIDNAFLATSMKEGREYLIKDQEIVPVDFESTGVVEVNTKWGDGLHQFLELKHQKKLSQMTLVTNFMSNQAFFKSYPGKLFGLSGTLGSESEFKFLDRHYGLSHLRIPTYLKKRFSENPGILCSNKDEWLECIGKKVEEHTSSALHRGRKRAVLIICEDINAAKEVKASMRCSSLTLFTENEEEETAVGKKLIGGDVIVATNIAGRGTDIEIDESVVKAGGLFVLVTFLPSNLRVETQVFGRCARKGQPGSAQLVINKESLPLYLKIKPFSDIHELKKIREENAQRRQDDNETSLLSSTIPRENLFSSYCQFIKSAAIELKDESEFEKKILLNSMHEFWGLWLKMNCENLKDLAIVGFEELKQRLNKALQTAKKNVMDKTSPCGNLYHIIKFANEQLIKNEFQEAHKLYTKAIETDKTWAAVAYYNRAYCSLLQRKDEGYMKAAISDFIEAKEGLRKFKDEVILSIHLLSILPKVTESEDESPTTTTKSQFETRSQILNFYEENIDKALNKLAELKKVKKEAKVVGHNALTIALGDDRCCKKLDSELLVFWNLGLTEIFSIEERCGFNWKAGLVGFLGVVEIAVGAFFVACSTGLLVNIGLCLITEGVNDVWTGAFAIYEGNQNFVKSWAIGKAASIALSIATFGFGQITSAFNGTKGIESAFTAAEQNFEIAGKEILAAKFKSFTVVAKEISKEVAEYAGKQVAVHAVKEVGTRGTKYVLESVNKQLKTNFENETRKQLKKELHKAMTSKGEFKDSFDKFVIIQSRNGKKKEEISDDFMKIHQTLLESTNSIRQLLHGCVNSLLKKVKSKMEKISPEVFKELLFPIFDVIDTHQKQSSVDVEQLVSFCCQEAGKALKEICSSDFIGIDGECLRSQATVISDVKHFMASKIEDHLFQLIQDSFECTVDGLDIEKLQNTVDGMVSKFSRDNGVGKNILQNIFSISKRSPQLVKDRQAMMNTGVDISNKGVDTFADEKTKKTAPFAFDTIRGGASALQSEDGEAMMNTGLDILNKGVNGQAMLNTGLGRMRDSSQCKRETLQRKYRQNKLNSSSCMSKEEVDKYRKPVCNRKENHGCWPAFETPQQLIKATRRKHGRSSLTRKKTVDKFVAAVCNTEREEKCTS